MLLPVLGKQLKQTSWQGLPGAEAPASGELECHQPAETVELIQLLHPGWTSGWVLLEIPVQALSSGQSCPVLITDHLFCTSYHSKAAQKELRQPLMSEGSVLATYPPETGCTNIHTSYDEDDEALAQGAQRSCGCPIPGRVQGQVGHRGLEQPALGEGVPAHGRGWNWMSFKVPSRPNRSGIL